MRIPEGYTEEQVIQIIQEVSKRLSHSFTFDIFAAEDIEQECFPLALKALEKYDGRTELRNFLSVHLRNRLHNLRRDWMSMSQEKHRLLRAAPLEAEPQSKQSSVLSKLEDAELRDYLNRNIPPDLRPDFLRLCDGYSLSHHRKKIIIAAIREILSDYDEI
jgi:DNA-directed RNA polymerase specialized sigma24 family protein